MKVLFTGATGVLGRRAVPPIVRAGHEVTALSRNSASAPWLAEHDVRSVEVDLFDPKSIGDLVAENDAVLHFATSIPPAASMTKRRSWATNDRIRSTATRLLVDAAIQHGVETFIQASVSLTYADGADRWLTEDSPIGPVWVVLQSALDAEQHVDRFVERGRRGIVLRFSSLYGPGRASQEQVDLVEARKLPIVGRGENYASSLHVDDAGPAILAALDVPSGTYNISDDMPVTTAEKFGVLADLIDARPPRHIPAALASVAVGPTARLLTVSHRVSNKRFVETTGWRPTHQSITEGWRDVLKERVRV